MIKNLLLTSAALLSVTGAMAQLPDYNITNKDKGNGTANVSYGGVEYSATFTDPNVSYREVTEQVITVSDESGVLTITCSGVKDEISTTEYTLTATSVSSSAQSITVGNLTGKEVNSGNSTTGTNYIGNYNDNLTTYQQGMEFAIELGNVNVLRYDEINKGLPFSYYIWGANFAGTYAFREKNTLDDGQPKKPNEFYYKDNTTYYTAYYRSNITDNRTTQEYTQDIFTVNSIADGFVNGNNTVTTITLGADITEIAAGAFRGAANLASIITDNNINFVYDNNILYNAAKTIIFAAGCDVADQKIPSSVAEIKAYAFANAKKQVNITTDRAESITIGGNQNDKLVLSVIKNELDIPSLDANGGLTVTDNVTKTNITGLITKLINGSVTAKYIIFSGNVTEDLGTLSNSSSTLLFFNTKFEVSGTNVINNGNCTQLVIKDKVDFYNPQEFTANSVSYNRQFTKDQWSTICLPFSATDNTFSTNFIGGSLNGFDESVHVFNFLYANTLAAYTPYIIKAKTNNATISLGKTTIPATSTSGSLTTSYGTASFMGTMSKISNVTSNATTTYYGFSSGNLVRLTGANIPAMRSYLSAPYKDFSAAQAPSIRLVDALDNEIETIEGEATGIASVKENEADKAIFNMKGQRVNNMANPGVYTINGKKVIIK